MGRLIACRRSACEWPSELSSEKPKQLTGCTSGKRWRLQTRMVQQISISRDNRCCVSLTGKRNEVIVVRIAQEGRRIDWVVQHDSGISNRRHYLADLALLKQVRKVGLAQGLLDLVQQPRTENRVEARLGERVVDQTRRAFAVRACDTGHQRAGVDDKALQPAALWSAARSARTWRTALIASRSISSDGTPANRFLTRAVASRPSWMRAALSSSSRSLFSGRRWRSRSSRSVSISTRVVGVAATLKS